MADTQLILHVKGTTQDTTTVPKPAVRAGIAEGRISYSQLIWSPIHEAWKQVRELPHLWPSQKMAPPPPIVRTTGTTSVAQTKPAASTPSVAVPRIAAAPGQAQPKVRVQPKVAVRVAGQPQAVPRVPSAGAVSDHHVVAEEPDAGHKIAKWLCIGIGSVIVLAVAANYLMVDRPLAAKMEETSFPHVSVYGHLGAFVQPGDLLIHVPASSALNESNFSEFLVALAHSTPPRPIGTEGFDRVSLTSGWIGRYSFAGMAWQELGDMGAQDAQAQKNFILDQVDTASGQSLAGVTMDPITREKVWKSFVRDFAKP
jgi:hypothetical protein